MKPHPAHTPEGELKREICAWLDTQPDIWYQRNVAGPVPGGSRQRKGLPDLILCVRGYFVAIELKAQKAPGLTEDQARTFIQINRAGGTAWLVRDLDSLIRWLRIDRLTWVSYPEPPPTVIGSVTP